MQNILPEIKTYVLSIKIGLARKRTFKSSLCVTDFTVSSSNFIRCEPFDTQKMDISLLEHKVLHLDHKYLWQLQRPGLTNNEVLGRDLQHLSLVFLKDFFLFITQAIPLLSLLITLLLQPLSSDFNLWQASIFCDSTRASIFFKNVQYCLFQTYLFDTLRDSRDFYTFPPGVLFVLPALCSNLVT